MGRNPHLLIEGCLIAARAILSSSVFIYIRGEYVAEWEVLQRAVDDAQAAGLFGDIDVVVHRGAGAYICGEETALLDSLRAGAASRGRGRRFRRSRASTCRRRRSTTCRRSRRSRRSSRWAPRSSRRSGRRTRRHSDLLALGQRREPRQLRARAGIDAPRADLRLRRRRPGRPRDQGDHPRRLVGADPHAGSTRHADGLRLDRRRRLVLRLGRGDGDRRALLHGAARAAGGEVLHARVVREVHAVPRGDALARPDPREDRGRPRPSTPTSTCSRTSATGSSAVAVRARRLRRVSRAELPAQVPQRSSRRTSSRAAARSAASRRSKGSSRRATSTRIIRPPRCRRDCDVASDMPRHLSQATWSLGTCALGRCPT